MLKKFTQKNYKNFKDEISIDFENNKFDFKNLKYINAETASVDRYKQSVDIGDEEELQEPKLPFLRWLISNVKISKKNE